MANTKDIKLQIVSQVSQRIDKLIHDYVKSEGMSRSLVSQFIKEQGVLVDGQEIKKASYKVKKGQSVVVDWRWTLVSELLPQNVHFKTIYEDDDIIVIAKPPNVVVHPGSGNPDNTLVNGLLLRYPEIATVGSAERPGIVHRLDKDTSGLMIVARSQRAYQVLVNMIKNKEIYREYRVAALGLPIKNQFTVNAPIYRDPHVPTRMAVVPWGKSALTTFYLLRSIPTEYGNVSMYRAVLSTGRTHQIRVHLRHMNLYPLGDSVYGNKISKELAPRVFLHSIVLKFIHPFTGETMSFMEPLPGDLLEAWKRLEVM